VISHRTITAGVAVLAIALSGATTACAASTVRSTGPLGSSGGEQGYECVPLTVGGTGTVGVTLLRNGGMSPVVIDRVAALDPRGVTVVRALLVPVTGNNLVGVWRRYPPARLSSGVAWSQRHPAADATLSPDEATPQNLVYEVRLVSASGGSAAGFEVDYHDDHKKYVLRIADGIRSPVFPNFCWGSPLPTSGPDAVSPS
jgi:hypothetical protein